ncbi:hypothetical protein [Maricaulis sp.]|uniref:hypothetical protein n=1 Tax=Maricaulis sp. TaxID=1486257 RepID=UPI000C365019|nr:hypothetical protein [Maricaulis sp.]MAC89682.1 hypothetical protein [Maricaulis sp.]
MPLTATLHIDQPPTAEWRDDRMHIQITCGDISFTRILTRYAAVGLLQGLQRELARSEGIGQQELCERLAREH